MPDRTLWLYPVWLYPVCLPVDAAMWGQALSAVSMACALRAVGRIAQQVLGQGLAEQEAVATALACPAEKCARSRQKNLTSTRLSAGQLSVPAAPDSAPHLALLIWLHARSMPAVGQQGRDLVQPADALSTSEADVLLWESGRQLAPMATLVQLMPCEPARQHGSTARPHLNCLFSWETFWALSVLKSLRGTTGSACRETADVSLAVCAGPAADTASQAGPAALSCCSHVLAGGPSLHPVSRLGWGMLAEAAPGRTWGGSKPAPCRSRWSSASTRRRTCSAPAHVCEPAWAAQRGQPGSVPPLPGLLA